MAMFGGGNSSKRFGRPSGAGHGGDHTVKKVYEGRLDELDELDLVRAGSAAAEFLPGGKLVSAVGAGVEGNIEAEREYALLEKAGITASTAKSSKAARKALERLDSKPMDNVIHYGVVALAGLAGGFLGATLGGGLGAGPVVAFLGMAAGTAAAGYIAEKIYTGSCANEEKDCVRLAAEGYINKGVSNEMALATLIESLPEKSKSRYAGRLQNAIGSNDFSTALTSDKGRQVLRQMMKEPELNNLLRAHIRLPRDMNQPELPVAQQYAELVNGGVIDARDIVLHREAIGKKAREHYDTASLPLASGDAELLVPSQVPHQGRGHAGKGHFSPA